MLAVAAQLRDGRIAQAEAQAPARPRRSPPPRLPGASAASSALAAAIGLLAVVASAEDVASVFTTPAPFKWVPDRPVESAISCLKYEQAGCSSIADMSTCLKSRDGTAVWKDPHGLYQRGEPCVWCGGTECLEGSKKLCEPYDFIANGKGLAFDDYDPKATLEVAHCTAELPEADSECLDWSRLGCNRITERETCLRSRDGRDFAEMDGFKIGGQPCVWCGGACTDKNGDVCAPFDWVMHGEGKAFQTFHAKDSFHMAACSNGKPVAGRPFSAPVNVEAPPPPPPPPGPTWWRGKEPTAEQTSCLRTLAHGCDLVKNKDVCLSSRDGRSGVTKISGMKHEGQPCVWCGGGRCDSDDHKQCAPWNYLMYGEGKEFRSFHAQDFYTVATCKDGKPIPADELPWGGARPLFEPPKPPSAWDQRCLEPIADGCSAANTMGDCLNSFDGRTMMQDSFGFKINRQPCVWCGGMPCTTNSTSNLCEPFDFVMHGEGKAFTLFEAKASFSVATCEEPEDRAKEAQQVEELSCLKYVSEGCGSLRDEASCVASRDGSSQKTFAGVKIQRQACVWCSGTACTSRNDNLCEPYDYAINGAGRAFEVSHKDLAWRVGMCKGGKASAEYVPPGAVGGPTTTLATSPEALAAAFSQCGGGGWSGPVSCIEGYVCRVQSEAFSQCMPSPMQVGGGSSRGAAATTGGAARFVTAGKRLFWQEPGASIKHLVESEAACSPCGCVANIELVRQEELDAMDVGSPFECAMVFGVNSGADEEDVLGAGPSGPGIGVGPVPGAQLGAGPTGSAVVGPAQRQPQQQAADAGAAEKSPSTSKRARDIGIILLVLATGAGIVAFVMSSGHKRITRAVLLQDDPDATSEDGEDWDELKADQEAPRQFQEPLTRHLAAPASMPPPAPRFVAAPAQAYPAPAMPAMAPFPGEPVVSVPAPALQGQYRTVTFTGQDAAAKAQAFVGVTNSSGAPTPAGSAGFILEPVAASGTSSAGPFYGEPVAAAASASAALALQEPIAQETMHPHRPPADVFAQIDANGDGQITREEWQQYAFRALDRDGNGVVSREEWMAARQPPRF